MNIASDQLKKIISCLFERNFNFLLLFSGIERIAIRNRVLEEQRAKIQKYFKFEVVNEIYLLFSNKETLNCILYKIIV